MKYQFFSNYVVDIKHYNQQSNVYRGQNSYFFVLLMIFGVFYAQMEIITIRAPKN